MTAMSARAGRPGLAEEMRHLCTGAADVLERHSCTKEAALARAPDVFDLQEVPNVSLGAYLMRLADFMGLTKPQFLLGVEYVDRYLAAQGPVLTPLSTHRIAATAMVLAHKFDNDFALDDRMYGKIAGVCIRDLERLQMAFMRRIGFNLMYPVALRDLPVEEQG